MGNLLGRLQEWLHTQRIRILLAIVGVCLLAYLITEIWLDKVKLVEKNVEYQWTILKDNCERRQRLSGSFATLLQGTFPTLAAELTQYAGYSVPVNLTDQRSVQSFCFLQAKGAQLLKEMSTQAASISDIAQNQHYLMLKEQLKTFELQIQSSSLSLDTEVGRFNQVISGYPETWVGTWIFHFKPLYSCHLYPAQITSL